MFCIFAEKKIDKNWKHNFARISIVARANGGCERPTIS